MGGAPAPKGKNETKAQYNARMAKYREELKFEKKYQEYLRKNGR
tara:strand:+ start:549 stop:680 length:132 start_codon:yes stop_codon:yes gene_type:complete